MKSRASHARPGRRTTTNRKADTTLGDLIRAINEEVPGHQPRIVAEIVNEMLMTGKARCVGEFYGRNIIFTD